MKSMHDDLPELVADWNYTGYRVFQVRLFNGNAVFIDMDNVRDVSRKNYKKWDQDKDDIAIRHYVERYYCLIHKQLFI